LSSSCPGRGRDLWTSGRQRGSWGARGRWARGAAGETWGARKGGRCARQHPLPGMGTGGGQERCASRRAGSGQLPVLWLRHRQAEVPPWKVGADALGSPCWGSCCLAVLHSLCSLAFVLAWITAGSDVVEAKLWHRLLPSTKILARGGWGSPWKSELSSEPALG